MASRREVQDRAVRVIVTGGGTGGHVYPTLTTVRMLQAELAERGAAPAETLWIGAAGSLEERVARESGIAFRPVATGKLRRAGNPLRMITWANLRDAVRVPLGAIQALGIVRGVRPDVVVGFGGYVAVPVSVAARVGRRPMMVHEQTVRLGLANRMLVRLATRTALSSESSLALLPSGARARAEVTGNPVRPELFQGEPDRARKALDLAGFDADKPTVYVTGGAQGAKQINALVTQLLPWLLERANVIHQCGAADFDRQRETSFALPRELAARYHLTPYVGAEMPDVYALADLVISRSGAGTIAEITGLGKAAVLIPLASSAGGEQAHNAKYLEEHGAARALVGPLTPEDLRAALEPLLADPAARAEMAAAAREQGRPEAARTLAALILGVAGVAER
ncbi:UDP-N-acetylglucosamine--N-acetylmuramyl-(pentapeptide) pyrophosphoryl-undecaprenol N-acetylglucosamine transferase [Actinospica durhamensis]|uniref:UDP-N-acetylglucosamine--N-acetylmuramyl- (pentapeptide) pyrophosphoryl-undecaprenol N-acetylglucosamine transferase n=1 Tax=Actinospica durhamensis TaxID=1508375 RepID=UPI001BA7FDE0|nr:UDP-N-acetylglucosamine--N-acetylmuramyl-(pentapeptide) pyrophosphoryl-undecaprenol N-acetylglucosamine transferase [Actinospica durhamensis]